MMLAKKEHKKTKANTQSSGKSLYELYGWMDDDQSDGRSVARIDGWLVSWWLNGRLVVRFAFGQHQHHQHQTLSELNCPVNCLWPNISMAICYVGGIICLVIKLIFMINSIQDLEQQKKIEKENNILKKMATTL